MSATREWYGSELPRWARALGVFGVERGRRGTMIRCKWAEFSWCFPKIALSLDASDGDDHCWSLHVALLFVQGFIYLPFLPRIDIKVGEMSRQWGFSWLLDSGFGYGDVHLNWDYRCKIVHMPWHAKWVRSSYLLPDGVTWAHETIWQQPPRRGYGGLWIGHGVGGDEWRRWHDMPKWERRYSYSYKLKSGEVQHRIATVKVEEREWRPWFSMWCPIFRGVQRTIAVDFSDEVGEKSGSWKGGCTGCGFGLLPNETPLECLRRMERERKF